MKLEDPRSNLWLGWFLKNSHLYITRSCSAMTIFYRLDYLVTILASTISEKVVNLNFYFTYKDIANLKFEHLTCQGRKIDYDDEASGFFVAHKWKLLIWIVPSIYSEVLFKSE